MLLLRNEVERTWQRTFNFLAPFPSATWLREKKEKKKKRRKEKNLLETVISTDFVNPRSIKEQGLFGIIRQTYT